jgi:hypothetical protein
MKALSDMPMGLRGDRPLWLEMADRLRGEPIPTAEADLYSEIAGLFEELTGRDFFAISVDPFFIEKYATGGMSSGYIDHGWWQDEAIDVLKRECMRLLGPGNFELIDDDTSDEDGERLPPNFMALKLRASTLEQYSLPDLLYPVPIAFLDLALKAEGHLSFAALLFGMQETMRLPDSDWKAMEPAAESLTNLLDSRDARKGATAEGENWWLELDDIDLSEEVVTIQRDAFLLAAVQPRPDGTLRLASYRPLDAKAISYLIGLSMRPHPEHGVCMRQNNWEYALDCSAGNGNIYACSAGETYLSYWQHGVGLDYEKKAIKDWQSQRELTAVSPSRTAAQLGAWYTFSEPD